MIRLDSQLRRYKTQSEQAEKEVAELKQANRVLKKEVRNLGCVGIFCIGIEKCQGTIGIVCHGRELSDPALKYFYWPKPYGRS